MASSTILEPMLKEAGCTLTPDRFGGVTFTFKDQASSDVNWNDAFNAILQSYKKESKHRGIWIQLNPTINKQAGVVMQAAIQNGFTLHTIDRDLIILKQWLSETENVLPDAPHHQIGIAGMVVNGRGEVLVIQERRGPTARLQDFWKLPGGLVDPGEDMSAAVQREVMEETGVNAKFHSIVTFRETHSGPFGSTDLYCVCAMTLIDKDAYTTDPSPQPRSPHPDEIKKVAWIPMQEFTGSKYYKKGLYGALLKTAAPAAIAAAKEAAKGGKKEGGTAPGMREIRMQGMGGKTESMFYAGQAKL